MALESSETHIELQQMTNLSRIWAAAFIAIATLGPSYPPKILAAEPSESVPSAGTASKAAPAADPTASTPTAEAEAATTSTDQAEEAEEAEEAEAAATPTDQAEEIEAAVPENIPLTQPRIEGTLATIASLTNRLLNVGPGPRPSVDDLLAYYAPAAQVSYFYTSMAPNNLRCLTRAQYREKILDLAGAFPDPLQQYRYAYRIDRVDLQPDGSEATVVGTTVETIAIGGKKVWQLQQAWVLSLIPSGDRVLVSQEVSSEELDLTQVPRCPRAGFMPERLLDRVAPRP